MADVLRDGVFTYSLPKCATYTLSEGDFLKLRPKCRANGRRALPSGWDSVILSYLKKDNPYCVFRCIQNRVKRRHSRKKVCPFFRGSLQCSFPGCHVKALLNIDKEDSRMLQTTYFGKVYHRGDVQHGRRIKGAERENMRATLRHEHPSKVHHQLLASMDPKVYASGNRDGVANEKVLQKISSEQNLRGRPYVDLMHSIIAKRRQFIEEDQRKNPQHLDPSKPHLFGFIQNVSLYPTVVMMWSKADLRLFHDLSPYMPMYFDATGNLARKMFEDTGKLLYYALVVPHPNKGKPPIAVAELFSSSQSVSTLTYFITSFMHDTAKLYRGRTVTPCHIEIDQSWAILHSVSRGFLGMELASYLQRCWRLVDGTADSSDAVGTVVHFCTSHVMNTIRRKLGSL